MAARARRTRVVTLSPGELNMLADAIGEWRRSSLNSLSWTTLEEGAESDMEETYTNAFADAVLKKLGFSEKAKTAKRK